MREEKKAFKIKKSCKLQQNFPLKFYSKRTTRFLFKSESFLIYLIRQSNEPARVPEAITYKGNFICSICTALFSPSSISSPDLPEISSSIHFFLIPLSTNNLINCFIYAINGNPLITERFPSWTVEYGGWSNGTS